MLREEVFRVFFYFTGNSSRQIKSPLKDPLFFEGLSLSFVTFFLSEGMQETVRLPTSHVKKQRCLSSDIFRKSRNRFDPLSRLFQISIHFLS